MRVAAAAPHPSAAAPPQRAPLTPYPPAPRHKHCSAAAYEALGSISEALRDFRATLKMDPREALAQQGAARCEALLRGGKGGARRALTDEETRVLIEIQGRLKDVQKQKARVVEQRRAAEAERRRAELTLAQLSSVPQDRRVFASVGRMYVLSSVPAEAARMAEAVKKNEERVRVCSGTFESLEAREKSEEGAFKEALGARG